MAKDNNLAEWFVFSNPVTQGLYNVVHKRLENNRYKKKYGIKRPVNLSYPRLYNNKVTQKYSHYFVNGVLYKNRKNPPAALLKNDAIRAQAHNEFLFSPQYNQPTLFNDSGTEDIKCGSADDDSDITDTMAESTVPAVLSALGIGQCQTSDKNIIDSDCAVDSGKNSVTCDAAGGGGGGGGGGGLIGAGGGGGAGAGGCGGFGGSGGACMHTATVLGPLAGCAAFQGGGCAGAAGGGGGGGGGGFKGGGGGGGGGGGSADCSQDSSGGGCNAKTLIDKSKTTMGCENLTLTSKKVMNYVNTLNCFISKSLNETNSVTNINQDLDVEISNSEIGGSLRIKQSGVIILADSTKFKNDVVSKMASLQKDAVDSALDVVQDYNNTHSGIGDYTSEVANRVINDCKTVNAKRSTSQKIVENINKALRNFSVEQKQKIRLKNVKIKGDVVITQDLYFEAVMDSLLNASSDVYKSDESFTQLTDMVTSNQKISRDSTAIIWVIIISAIVLGVVLILSAFFTMKKSNKKMEAQKEIIIKKIERGLLDPVDAVDEFNESDEMDYSDEDDEMDYSDEE